eukprot:6842-Heterococcus_DN1.PRE.3
MKPAPLSVTPSISLLCGSAAIIAVATARGLAVLSRSSGYNATFSASCRAANLRALMMQHAH